MHEFDNYDIINIKINNEIYKLWVADTNQKKIKGLSGIDFLPRKSGMIFIYNKPTSHSFSMRKTKIPLKIIFLNHNYEVVDYYKCIPYYQKPIKSKNPFTYVIEI